MNYPSDPEKNECFSVYLKAGELHIATKPTKVSIILGSCISIIFFCKKYKTGAATHCALPFSRPTHQIPDGFKYIDFSIKYLIDQFGRLGITLGDIEVKLFGGADVLQVYDIPKKPTIGRQNIKAALSIIENNGLNLIAKDVGGKLGRKLIFISHTGEVLLRHNKNLK